MVEGPPGFRFGFSLPFFAVPVALCICMIHGNVCVIKTTIKTTTTKNKYGRKECPTFSLAWIFLVLYGSRKSVHDLLLLQGQNAHPLDDTRQAIRGTSPLPVVVRLEQKHQQTSDQFRRPLLDRWHQRGQAVGHSFLHLV